MLFNDIPKFIINASGYEWKWNKCVRALDKKEITNYHRFPAIVPNAGGTLIDRIMGCKLSHLALYNKMIAEKMDYMVIFEDDIEINPKFKEYINEVETFISSSNFDLFYLGGRHVDNKLSDRVSGHIVRAHAVLTTHSYIINIKTVQKLIDSCINEDINKDKGIDTALCQKIQPLGESFITLPNLFCQRLEESVIRKSNRDYYWLRDW